MRPPIAQRLRAVASLKGRAGNNQSASKTHSPRGRAWNSSTTVASAANRCRSRAQSRPSSATSDCRRILHIQNTAPSRPLYLVDSYSLRVLA
jgi:hypothetical protein